MVLRVKNRLVKFTPEEEEEIKQEVIRLEKSYNEKKRQKIGKFWGKFRHLIAQFPPTLSGATLLENCDINDHFAIFKLSQPITKKWYVNILLYGQKRGLRKKECFKILAPEGQNEAYSNYIVIRNISQDKYFEERMIKFFRLFHMKRVGLEAIALVINRRKTPPKPLRRDYKWYRMMEQRRAERKRRMAEGQSG